MSKWIRLVVVVAIGAALACGRKAETPASATAASPQVRQAVPAQSAAAGAEGTEVGSMVPPYTTKLLDGGPFDLAAERGKVVFLNLWATWCGPCRYEIPELEAMHVKYASRGFTVVGVSLDEGAPGDVKAFVTEHKMTYPIALDPEGHLADLFKTSVIPTSILIDRTGKIVWKKFGIVSASDDDLTKALETALAGK